jgi:hypothetical protein
LARVRVSAIKLGSERAPVPRLAYCAQVYSDDGRELMWACLHEHDVPVDAHLCGVQYLTDQLVGPQRLPQTA